MSDETELAKVDLVMKVGMKFGPVEGPLCVFEAEITFIKTPSELIQKIECNTEMLADALAIRLRQWLDGVGKL